MNKVFSVAGLVALLAASVAPTAAVADDGLAFNVGAVSDYRYRGISQSRLKPALQGGVDYTKGPFYVGAWASTIKWIKDFGGDSNAELDVYGGYKGELGKDLTFDVGALRYQYVRNHLSPSPNTTELYGALTYGITTVKYSHSVTNLFGFGESKNSNYIEAAAGFDVGGGFSVTPHLGYQRVAKNSDFSYWDYSVTVSKEVIPGLGLTAAIVGTDTKTIGGTDAYASPANGKDLGRFGLVVGAKYSF
jgi:uncharacterized protein (TIGR02001 family)